MILRIGALGIILIAAFLAASALLPEEPMGSLGSFKMFFLNKEQKALYAECESMRKQLKSQGLSSQFATVLFRVRDHRLEQDPILEDVKKCFHISAKSPLHAEVELFSSDYDNQSSADLQVQISIIEIKSGNKIAEVGFRIDHKPIVTAKNTESRNSATSRK